MVEAEMNRVGAREKVERRRRTGPVDKDVGEHPSATAPGEEHRYEEEGAINDGDEGRCTQVARRQVRIVDDAAGDNGRTDNHEGH